MATSFNYNTKKTGRLRGPNLSDPRLKVIGDAMVAAQKDRWDRAVDAEGQAAKKLSVRYAIIKQALLHQRPKRDMQMTGRTVANFTLRKAADGKIRAENTTRLERQKATRANSYDQMIGFAVSDLKVVFDETKAQYGQYAQTAWVPLQGSGSNGNGVYVPSASTYSSGAAANRVFMRAGKRSRRPSVMVRRP
jgi:hypothetical protein